MKIPFLKMHGLGNDFVIINNQSKKIQIDKNLIIKIASRNFGVGCDQILIINNFLDNKALIKIYNNDGSETGACGNGVRCLASYLMDINNLNNIIISTIEDELFCWKEGKLISVNMGKPKFKPNEIPLNKKLNVSNFEINGFKLNCLSFGNPHAVVFLKSLNALEKINISQIGSMIEKHENFPQGVNVEFATILDDKSIRMKVWERGVGVTAACGSGACATLVVANMLNISGKKNKLILDGGELAIHWKDDENVVMTGEVEQVFEGKFYVNRK